MGATKTKGDDHVRWISNGQPINPQRSAWLTDPTKDEGQFYAQNNNVSCLIMYMYNYFSLHGWGKNDRKHWPLAKTLCEKRIG